MTKPIKFMMRFCKRINSVNSTNKPPVFIVNLRSYSTHAHHVKNANHYTSLM